MCKPEIKMLSIKDFFITGKKPFIKLQWSIGPSYVEAGGPGVQGSLVYVSYVAVGGHPGLHETLVFFFFKIKDTV